MKKQLLFLAGFAAILASCSREADITPEVKEPHHIIIQANVADTRTSLTIDGTTGTYSWDVDEVISVLEENASEPCEFQVFDRDYGYFDGVATNDLVGAVSPALALGMYEHNGTDLEYMLSLTGDYAYADGTNAVMVAGEPTPFEGPEGTYQKFTFQHAAGLVMVTYENLPYGTKGLRFTTNKPIVGDWTFSSFDNVVLDGKSTGSTTAYVMFENAIGNEDLNKTFSFYIPVPVNDYTGIEIALVDDAKNDIDGTIKKMSSKQFSIALGGVVKFPTITLTPAEVQEAGYNRISSTADLESGQYLIVYETDKVAFNGGLETLDAIGNTISVTPVDGRIELSSATEAAEFTFAVDDDDWTIKSASGLYIGKTASGNGLDAKTSVLTNSVSFSGNNVVITASGGSVLKYNDASNQNRFRYYGSGQKDIQLYKKVAGGPVGGKTEVSLSFNPEGPFTVNSSEAESFTAPTLVNPAGVPVTYSITGGNELVEIDEETGELTFVNGLDACTITVTASFPGSSVYEAATASYTITIVAPINGIAALKALVPSDGTDYPFIMNLTDAVVTSVSTQSSTNGSHVRIFMQDESAGIVLYDTDAALAEKDVLNGIVTGKAMFYQGLYEIVEIDILSATKTTQATLPCDEYTIEEILTLGMDTESMRVKVSLADVRASGTKFYLDQGEASIQYYDRLKVTTLNDGDLVNVTGYYTLYVTNSASTPELCVYSADDVEVLDKPVVTLSGVPSNVLSAAEQDLTVNYSVTNPISGAVVSATTEAEWLDAEAEDGEIYIMVGSNDGENVYSTERTGVVTVSYPHTADQTITITQSGNSFAITYATVPGGTLSGPARAKADEEVTLTATPAGDNYSFNDDWTVTPEVAGISVSVENNKFMMPASAVLVSGSFTKAGGGTTTSTINVSNVNGVHTLGSGNYTNYNSEQVITVDGLSIKAKNICKNNKNTPSGATAGDFIQFQKNTSYIKNSAATAISSIVIKSVSVPEIKLGASESDLSAATVSSGSTETVHDVTVTTYTVTVPTGSLFFSIAPTSTFHLYEMVVTYTE